MDVSRGPGIPEFGPTRMPILQHLTVPLDTISTERRPQFVSAGNWPDGPEAGRFCNLAGQADHGKRSAAVVVDHDHDWEHTGDALFFAMTTHCTTYPHLLRKL